MPQTAESQKHPTPSITMLVSRISARGRAEREGRQAVRQLRAAGWEVTVQLTDMNDHLPDTVRKQTGRLIGAVGGDGYLAAVASGMAGIPDRVLVPFPGGRGNDLCRSLGIGTSSFDRALDLTAAKTSDLENRIRGLDGMWVHSPAFEEARLAFGVVSLGIDAAANQYANRSSLRYGPLVYAWGTVKAFCWHRFHQVWGTIDGELHDFTGWISSVSNTGCIGGGVNLVSSSRSDDGLLEVFNVARTSRWKVLPLLLKVLGRGDSTSPLVNIYSGTEIQIEAETETPAMADGDLVGYTPLNVRVAPSAVQVLV